MFCEVKTIVNKMHSNDIVSKTRIFRVYKMYTMVFIQVIYGKKISTLINFKTRTLVEIMNAYI